MFLATRSKKAHGVPNDRVEEIAAKQKRKEEREKELRKGEVEGLEVEAWA